jgi:hypothetical protein
MSTERDSLEIHVDLCELRYKQLEARLSKVEKQMQEINIDIQDFKTECRASFHEIKLMLQSAKDDKFKVLVSTAGTIIVALVGALGYMMMHIK